jgi:hypothetical protein
MDENKRVLHPGAYNSLLWKCSTFLCCNVCRREKIQKKGREHLQKRIGSESLTVYVYRDIQWPPIIMMLGKIEKKERFNMF